MVKEGAGTRKRKVAEVKEMAEEEKSKCSNRRQEQTLHCSKLPI